MSASLRMYPDHSCHPNCYAAWNARLGQQTVHALSDIAPEEEMSLAYVGGAEAGTRARRQEILKTKYHFECDCMTCELKGVALERSEARQRRMAEIHSMLATSPADLSDRVDELLHLLHDEELPLVWAKSGVILTIVQHMQRAEHSAAARWAARGAEHACLALGTDSSVYLKFASLQGAIDPTATAGGVTRVGASAASTTVALSNGTASAFDAAATTASAAGDTDDDDEPPRNPTYVVASSQSFERGAAEDWPAGAGLRVLHFRLLSHRQRWAHRLWPAAQVLARWLDAHPDVVVGRSVLEIGAGAALPSVIAGLLGARALVVSDWPDERMLKNMETNLSANLLPQQYRCATVIGYDWNKPPQALLAALASLQGGNGFDLILLSDLLYECEHEPILRAVAATLSTATPSAEPTDHATTTTTQPASITPCPRALLTYQVHDECQQTRQAAFFDLAPRFGLSATRLLMVDVGKQFEEAEAEPEGAVEEDGLMSTSPGPPQEDITRLVQLWELVRT